MERDNPYDYGYPDQHTTQPGGRVTPPDTRPYVPPAMTPERQKAFDDFWRTIKPDTSYNDILNQGYQYFLGRPGDPEGMSAHLGNPGGMNAVIETLYDSPEAATYRSSRATTPTTTTGASGTGWVGGAGTGLNLGMPTGLGGYGRLEGFNTDRAFAGGDPNSVKDAFARWVTGLGFDPTQASKPDIEAAIRKNLDSAKAFGLNILDVQGDQILIETKERGPEWVDVVRGAGGGDAAWQWLTQQDMTSGGGGGGGATGNASAAASGASPDAMLAALLQMIGGNSVGGSSNALQQILQELQSQAQGRGSPMARSSLLQQLGR